MRINAAALLCPYLRERITALTAMAGLTPYYLPSKNFIATYEDWQEKERVKNIEHGID
ncbi:MAG: protein-export chaperone SecB [Deferribacteraceae bacterium]|nr:protein-export chaperone SecB [Deferribacteraceae bacterium]